MATDYYAILGVSREASDGVIRTRFRELAREQHPDRFHGEDKERAERAFQSVTEAFNALSDPERRRQHDAALAERPARPGAAGGNAQRDDLARTYLARGVQAYRGKRYLEAADSFDRATRADPERAQSWYYLALAASHEERWLGKAQEAIDRACELAPMNVLHLRAAGRIHGRAGDLGRARSYYRKALEWSADDPAIRAELEALEARRSKAGRGRVGRS